MQALCNHFLREKFRNVESSQLTNRMFDEYKVITDMCVKQFGASTLVDNRAAGDFAALRATMSKVWAWPCR